MIVNGKEVADMIDYIDATNNFKNRFENEKGFWEDLNARDRYLALELIDTLNYFNKELVSTDEMKDLLSTTVSSLKDLKSEYDNRIKQK